MQLLGAVVAARSLRLERDVPPSLPLVRCDRRRILQVFSNLIGNAVKSTPAGGVIRLLAREQADGVCFAVSDTGCGIPASQMPRLFERGSRTGTQSWEGAGLGLFIAKTIVEAHGGRLWVDSDLGAGSTFFFTLPLVPAYEERSPRVVPGPDVPAPGALDTEDPSAQLRGLRALLVDDEPNAVSALATLLGDLGLVVAQATSGAQALAAAEAQRPEVVVLDMEMPGMSGLVLLHRLRERHPELPAVFMSGYMEDHARIEEARAATGAAYVTKPVNVDRLVSVLGQLFADRIPRWRPCVRADLAPGHCSRPSAPSAEAGQAEVPQELDLVVATRARVRAC